MTFAKIERRSLPGEVYDRVLGELVAGSLTPGQALPSERALAEALGVSRPAVREALQRMAHAGLVKVRQGGATTVSDFRRTGGLDILGHLLLPGGDLDLAVARSILEARLAIGPVVAGLAAERHGHATALPAAVTAIETDTDPVGRQRQALAFWELVVDAADSVAFRLMFNSLRAAYEPALVALSTVMADEVDRVDAYRALAAAITEGDADTARRLAHDLLNHATQTLLHALDLLEGARR
ncbi:FadR/GntR family transcriptional regulator [Catellatospora chokoriensis]|uniref:GntR family transcriptional regulator n=1 Tax=Catellatospora chokoriensis TaxID=310353 RepID=A0A8J3NSQ6_9ACTN|nr:GntR family transcriptional regulator [Catellatospora chokoriensis]GIF91272.1 GntR family transcriptional regulator [Catellatospora chokoriensis]